LREDVDGKKTLQERVAVVVGHVGFTISESFCSDTFAACFFR
jgi:hypothetical protein